LLADPCPFGGGGHGDRRAIVGGEQLGGRTQDCPLGRVVAPAARVGPSRRHSLKASPAIDEANSLDNAPAH
jgi:hypothetical protein